jgi:hypothetical protein
MGCELQNRLSELFTVTVNDYAHAIELVSETRVQRDLFRAAQHRADEARIRCETARQALMKHHIEHGC